MYQPISFNVIRQALDWHNFPIPSLRQLSFYEWPDGSVTAEYLATWSECLIPQKYFQPSRWLFKDGIADFWCDLQECFCKDVEVKDVTWSDPLEEMTAVLYVEISPEIARLPRLFDHVN